MTSSFFAVTLFVDDLDRERTWYGEVFGMPVVDESPESCTFQFPNGVYVNLNTVDGALYHLATSPTPGSGSRAMSSVQVDDIDAELARIAAFGVKPVTGPTDQPWGSRGATIVDPSGNYWELFSRPAKK